MLTSIATTLGIKAEASSFTSVKYISISYLFYVFSHLTSKKSHCNSCIAITSCMTIAICFTCIAIYHYRIGKDQSA